MNDFLKYKIEFDKNYSDFKLKKSIVTVNGVYKENISLKSGKNEKSEEYYKWQFFYSIIKSGLYPKENIGAEIAFPKGSKGSSPIKLDGAIFDDKDWLEHYNAYKISKSSNDLDWLRKHLIGVIEFKNNSKNLVDVYNTQLKPVLKESEKDFVLGVLYDSERLFLFKKVNNKFLRLDEGLNEKGDKSSTKQLSFNLTDGYYKIPKFEQLLKKNIDTTFSRANRTIDDLDIITGMYSKQLKSGIFEIIKIMDQVGLKDIRGYSILIELLALKIFDEKQNETNLQFFEEESEYSELKNLNFYITSEEKNGLILDAESTQNFIKRIKKLYERASQKYHQILKEDSSETIIWKKSEHIRIISEIVFQLQDYSFVRSSNTDLYQIIFYEFADQFSKADKSQFLTPIPLIDFLVKIICPKSGESLIDPTCGIADFLSVAYVNSKGTLEDNNLYGIDNDEYMIKLAQLNMLLNGDGNAILKYKPNLGSIRGKYNTRNEIVDLKGQNHKNGNWDNWSTQTKLKKFNIVLTNPPFGDDRKFEAKEEDSKDVIKCYEIWERAKQSNSIDLGAVFLENAVRILEENGRLGIILSNSIATIPKYKQVREWLLENTRLVATFDLPSNVFADTGVNVTLIIAYKPTNTRLQKLIESDYEIFISDIKKVGYEIKTVKRVKEFIPNYKRNNKTFDVEQDEYGNPLLDEEFSETLEKFKEWCKGQESELKKIFLD